MRFAAPRFASQDQTAPVGHKVRGESRAQERETDGRLMSEVEIVDRLQKGKPRAAHEPVQARLLPMGDFFRHQA